MNGFWGDPVIADALPAALGIAAAAAAISVLVRAHRLGFLVVGVAHASLAGAGLAALLRWPLLPAAGFVAVGLAVAFAFLPRARIDEDATAGLIFAGGMALGLVLIAAADAQATLFGLLFGDVLAIDPAERRLLWFGLGIVAIGFALGARAWWMLAADAEAAEAEGHPVRHWRAALHALVGLCVMLGVKLTGIVLTAGLLMLPAAIAWPWVRGLASAFLGAVLASLLGTIAGLWLSWRFDAPAGAAIVLALMLLWGLSLAASVLRR